MQKPCAQAAEPLIAKVPTVALPFIRAEGRKRNQ